MFGTLFETPEDKALAHCHSVLAGDSPFGLPTAKQQALLRIVMDKRGARFAISIGELAERLRTNPRSIKADVRDLRLLFKVRIGSSRDSEEGGFYLITNKEEALDTVRPLARQAQAEFEIVRAILESHEMAELEGQLRFTMQPSAADLDAVAEEQRIREATSGKEATDACV